MPIAQRDVIDMIEREPIEVEKVCRFAFGILVARESGERMNTAMGDDNSWLVLIKIHEARGIA